MFKKFMEKVKAQNSIIDQNPLYMQITPEEKLARLVVPAPGISLNEGEVCYYCKAASAVHQKNVVTGRTSGGAGVSFRVAKGVSIRTGGGNSQVIRENVNECFEGTLYITNIRIILLAPKYGFDLYISKISQFLYKSDGFQVFVGSKCHSVMTNDIKNISALIEFMNQQRVFKDEKWLKQQQKQKAVSSRNMTQELRELKSLLDEGIITEEEFTSKKKQLLGL